MRVLYFSRDYTPHDHRFLLAIAQSEHRVAFLQLERRGHVTEDRSLPPQIEQIPWAGGQREARISDTPRLLVGLQKVIRQFKPDLIHAGPVQRSAFLVALAGFHPLVSMSWGYDLLIDARRDRWWQWATRYTLQRSDAFIGDCDAIRQLAVSYGMRPDRMVAFPWGIDLRHFSPADLLDRRAEPADRRAELVEAPAVLRSSFDKLRMPQDGEAPPAFTILSTRSWEPIYGVDVIAKAFVLAARQRPELRLFMLGNGSLAGELRRIFAQTWPGSPASSIAQSAAQNAPTVVYPGHIGFADLPRYYRQADLYLSASHSDGSSISLLEAMGCGLPVLVSDIPGNREWVIQADRPGQNGWLFPDGDVNALARAIVHAVEERQRLPQLGQNARALVEQRADWQKNFPQTLQAYQLVLKP